MPDISAGLLMYKFTQTGLQFFIVHPGGPFWASKDEGAWSIPKGIVNTSEHIIEAAKREFFEETGLKTQAPFIELGTTRLKSGKTIHAWAFEGDWQGLLMCSTYINLEYPYKSGKFKKFPEVDKAGFFHFETAKKKIHPAQVIFIERLYALKNS